MISFLRKIPKPGPGALITAAFIGPGTITTCTLAGASFGFALLWGLVFSVVATIVLQEMAARLGIYTGAGLGEALRNHFNKGLARLVSLVLVISAITIGNAAFETGNILGAKLGLESVLPVSYNFSAGWIFLIGSTAFIILLSGSYKFIEKALIGLVILMSITFIATAIIAIPPFTAILKGMFIPRSPEGSLLTLMGLIGTTVVPYNLFLYASAVTERYKSIESLSEARTDMVVAVVLGGMISMAIVITSATTFHHTGTTPIHGGDLSAQLEPLLGSMARYFTGLGLFAAGISSAITAPLAAAYATAGIMGWKKDLSSWRFRIVWMIILATGMSFSLMELRPLQAILFAQAANGILLPVIAVYLLWVVNSKKIMGTGANNTVQNITGILVALIAIILGARSLWLVMF